MSKKISPHPEAIRIIKSKSRKLEVDYNHNTCDIEVCNSDCELAISLSEFEAKKLHKALSRFLDLRNHLRTEFWK